jgi:hypothetical protein
MKALNRVRHVAIKYPRDTPRVSRKRLWYDRSEWRQDPQAIYEGSNTMMDHALDQARNQPSLQQSPTWGIGGIMNHVGRQGLKKL